MDDIEIDLLCKNDGPIEKLTDIITRFLANNQNVFSFPNLSKDNKRVILWTALFQYVQDSNFPGPFQAMCLSAVRILSRDKADLENVICEKWITVLIEKAGFYNKDSNPMELSGANMDVTIEALKCLCNIAYNSEVARALCAHTCLAQSLVGRLGFYNEIPCKEDIMLYDMKLLFILTALRKDIKALVKDELHGADYLISALNELIGEATTAMDTSGACGGTDDCFLSDHQEAIACEILKTLFNVILKPSEDPPDDSDDVMFLKLVPMLASVLHARTSNEDKLMELRSNVANLLTSVPPNYYTYLTPEVTEADKPQHVYAGANVDAIHALVELLQYRLTKTTNTKTQYESLAPILTVVNKSGRGCRLQRKYLRQVVLPPLKDVSLPPEKGHTLRNQMCRLLTTPVSSVRDLAAEFLFVLCKEKVGRMVKYTGFGNAAGHLAQKGLLGGGRGGRGEPYSSSSDDSDTEEYIEASPNIDPVVGCTRPPRIDPFQGMTEEQKEYEAMKLVNLFDRMVSAGAVRPARIGPDGRPQPVEHVLEFRDHPPNRPQS